MKKVIIAAVAENNVIGKKNGQMSWDVAEDQKHFMRTTLGYPIIMGRKTFETLGGPLKGRVNIVLSRIKDLHDKNIHVFSSLINAYNYCIKQNYNKAFIIGGGEVYSQTIDDADEMIISKIHFEAEGDVYFPKIDEKKWEVNKKEERTDFTIYWYEKKKEE